MPRLNYRPPLAADGTYADWIHELKNASGAYVIKAARDGEILYVGESHSARLKDTLTRHFREWNGPQARTTYNPAAVLVAVILTPPRQAIPVQNGLIFQLQPSDNLLVPEGTDGPAEEPF